MNKIIVFIAILILAACAPEPAPTLPAHTGDPCLEDILNGVPEELRRCAGSSGGDDFETDPSTGGSDCSAGCTTHVDGCDIKGNISIDSGEKIYHVPGQEFYSSTNIDPEYGERWFCTESEASANGWRKSSK